MIKLFVLTPTEDLGPDKMIFVTQSENRGFLENNKLRVDVNQIPSVR